MHMLPRKTELGALQIRYVVRQGGPCFEIESHSLTSCRFTIEVATEMLNCPTNDPEMRRFVFINPAAFRYALRLKS